MAYTKKELLAEITRIKGEMFDNLNSGTYLAVRRRQQELLSASRVNLTKSGAVRYYLTKNAKYEEVDDYLTQLINAMYDVCGYCFQYQLDKESQRAKSLAFFMLPGVLPLKLSASGLTRTDLEKKATEQTPELITSIFVKMQ